VRDWRQFFPFVPDAGSLQTSSNRRLLQVQINASKQAMISAAKDMDRMRET
jgi:hypothetical protein